MDFKINFMKELDKNELMTVDGGLPWIYIVAGWVAVEVLMNPVTTADVFTSAAEDELANIRQGN